MNYSSTNIYQLNFDTFLRRVKGSGAAYTALEAAEGPRHSAACVASFADFRVAALSVQSSAYQLANPHDALCSFPALAHDSS